MRPSLEDLAGELERLGSRLASVEARLGALERREGPARAGEEAPLALAADHPLAAAMRAEGAIVPLVGRTLLVLGGAFLLRAVAEAGALPPAAAALLGLAYGLLWLATAVREGAGRRISALFHIGASVLIAYPLIFEATLKLGAFTPAVAATALVVSAAGGVLAARRTGLAPAAWGHLVPASLLAFALQVATGDVVVFVSAQVALLALAESASLTRWSGLRWPATLMAALALLGAFLVATRPTAAGGPAVPAAWAGALALLAALLVAGASAVRTLVLDQRQGAADAFRVGLAALVGYAAAMLLLGAALSPVGVGLVGVLLGSASYAAAFGLAERRAGSGAAFYAYANLGLGLLLLGSGRALDDAGRAVLWALLAVVGAALGVRFDRGTLRFHGLALLLAAVLGSGLARAIGDGLVSPAAGEWSSLAGPGLLTAAAAAATAALMLRGVTASSPARARVPALAGAGIAALAALGLGARVLAGPLAGAPGTAADAGSLGALRAALPAWMAVLLAAWRRGSGNAAGALVWPLLVLGALSLAFDALPRGRPATSFVALAAYGLALIVASRLARSKGD